MDALTKYKNENLLGKGAQANTPRVTQIVHILKGQKNYKLKRSKKRMMIMVLLKLSKPILRRMEKLYRRQLEAILNPEFKQEYEFPTLAGSYLHMKNPALELVKFLCHVFALSEKRSKEVRILKKNYY